MPLGADSIQERIYVVRCIHEEGGKAWIQMSRQTRKNPLSKREVESLRSNPYVASVTTQTVRFTEEFKRLAYEGKQQGVTISETMRRCGMDPEVFGTSRIEGFSYTLNKKVRQDGGFLDGRSGNYRQPAKTGEDTMEQRLKEL